MQQECYLAQTVPTRLAQRLGEILFQSGHDTNGENPISPVQLIQRNRFATMDAAMDLARQGLADNAG